MQITITARHCEVTDILSARAREVMKQIARIALRPVSATVVFDVDGPQHTVELRLHISRGDVVVAHGEGSDHRTAIDRAEERLRRQVEAVRGRVLKTRHHSEAPAT